MHALGVMQSPALHLRLSPSSHRLSPPSPVSGITKRCHASSSLSYVTPIKCGSILSCPSPSSEAMKFAEGSKKENLVPLRHTIFSDHLTPVLAYRCLVKEDDQEAPSFLFESVEPGHHSSTVGRYSVVGAHPKMEIVAKENKVTVMDHVKGTLTTEEVEDPMMIPRRITETWKPQLIDDLPDAFCGGWVGYFFMIPSVMPKRESYLSPRLRLMTGICQTCILVDMHLGLYDDVIVFDHVEKKMHIIHWVRLSGNSSLDDVYVNGVKHLEELVLRIKCINPRPKLPYGSVDLHTNQFGTPLKKSSMTSDAYKNAVLQAKEHILAGDIF